MYSTAHFLWNEDVQSQIKWHKNSARQVKRASVWIFSEVLLLTESSSTKQKNTQKKQQNGGLYSLDEKTSESKRKFYF